MRARERESVSINLERDGERGRVRGERERGERERERGERERYSVRMTS